MAFQFDEKLMAPNRAIITRNLTESDLFEQDPIKNKPGMMHYVEDSCKLFMSIKPITYEDLEGNKITKNYAEIITELNANTSQLGLGQYIKKIGGESNAMTGQFYSIYEEGSPFNVKSSIVNTNLNADLIDGFHASLTAIPNTICIRDTNSNININSKINFTNNFIESTNNLISFKNNTGYTDIQCSGIAMNNANNKSRISWNGTDWIANINNNDYRIITTKTMDDFNVYGANIVMQKSAPTNVINEDTYWFEVVGE